MIDPSIRLRRAIHRNDIFLVRRLVRNHQRLIQNPDFSDRSNTSLHLAAAGGHTTIALFLIQAGHDKLEISRNADNDTPLMLAAKKGHVEVGKLLAIEFPRGISMMNKYGLDALALACQNAASTGLIPILLNDEMYPASVHSLDREGNTPLHHASASGSLKALRILLAAGADSLAKNNYDWTPLAYSQTVAAEVYFKNLVAEFERRKVEGARMSEERERQKAAGVRLVERGDGDEANADVSKRHWTPVERMRPMTPGSTPRTYEWGSGVQDARTRSGSGG